MNITNAKLIKKPNPEDYDAEYLLIGIRVTINGQEYTVPIDENNRDYQEYLVWLEEGNVPEEPDTNNGGGE